MPNLSDNPNTGVTHAAELLPGLNNARRYVASIQVELADAEALLACLEDLYQLMLAAKAVA